VSDTPTSAAAGGSRARRALPLVIIAALAVVAAVVNLRSGGDGPLLDPASTEANGTKALRLILEEVGADVEVVSGPPLGEFDTMLLMLDNIGGEMAREVADHVNQGGVLVVTDFGGRLTPGLRPSSVAGSGIAPTTLERGCEITALADVDEIRITSAPLFEPPNTGTGCYRVEDDAWLIIRPRGDGTLVTTGGAEWLTNRGIAAGDNAVLATALLAPSEGTRVAIVRPDLALPGVAGRTTLSDLMPTAVKLGLLQLLVAFGVVVLWRARRLGAPLREVQPVRLPASELVLAVGNLFQRTAARERAAGLLRSDLRTLLTRRLGIPGDDPALPETLADRADMDVAEVADVLHGPPPQTDQELVLLAQRAESIRASLTAPVGAGGTSAGNE
jgi:hypothetical protein